MKIERFFEMPNVNTFEMPKLRKWILRYCEGKILNVFAGKTKLKEYPGVVVYNDLNKALDADFHYDATEISKYFKHESFNTILFDPPYTHFQGVHYYNGVLCRDDSRAKDEVDILLKPGGICISLGYNSTGMGKKRGYEKLAVLIVNCGAGHNDILVTVERKTQTRLGVEEGE